MKSPKVLFLVICLLSSVGFVQRLRARSFSPAANDATFVPGTEVEGMQAAVQTPASSQVTKPQPVFKTRNVAIVLYEGVELLDFAGPGEVFTHAVTVTGEAAFNVYTVGTSTEPLVSQGFLTIKPQYSFENAPKPDIVVFPGGSVGGLLDDKAGMNWAKTAAQNAEIAMSVCNGNDE